MGGGLIKLKPFFSHTWSPKLISEEVSYGFGLHLSLEGGSLGREGHDSFLCRVRELKNCLSLLSGAEKLPSMSFFPLVF